MAKAVLAAAPMGAKHDCLWSAAVLVQVVEEKAARTPGKKSLAIEAYARALRSIPGTICDNGGEPKAFTLLWAVTWGPQLLPLFKLRRL